MANTENKYSKLVKNSAIFAAANFGSSVLRFIIVPFYTYYLTTSQYGMVDTLNTTVSLAMPIMILAVQEAVLRFTLSNDYQKESVFKTAILLLVIGSIIFLFSYFPFQSIRLFDGLWCYFYVLLVANAINNIMLNYSKGTGKSIVFMCGGIINTFIMLVSNIVMLAFLNTGIKGYIISLILGYVVSSLYVAIYIKPAVLLKKGNINSALLKQMLKYSVPLIPAAAMWWLMNVSDKYIITYIKGVAFTGIYAVAHKIPTIISLFYTIFQQAWQISAVEEVNAADRSAFYESVYEIFFKGLFLISSFVILIIKPLLTVVVAPNYVDAWKYAPVLVISAVFSSMAGFLGVNYAASGKTIGALTTAALGAVTNIVFNIILVPVWGVQGAAVATLIGFYIVWIVRATISDGGLKIKQKYGIIHFMLALEIIQSVVVLSEIKYNFIIQCVIIGIIIICSKNTIIQVIKKCLTLFQRKRLK